MDHSVSLPRPTLIALCATLCVGASPALAQEGIWRTTGQDASRGAYEGRVEVTRTRGRFHLSGIYTFADGATLTWSGSGAKWRNRLYVGIRHDTVGIAGRLAGGAANIGTGAYVITPSGLEGGWRSSAHQVTESLRRLTHAPAPAVALSAAEEREAAESLRRIEALMEHHTDRREEAEVLSILHEADAPKLNWLLDHLDLHEVGEDMDDRLIGPDNKSAFFDLLSNERLGDLTVGSRARFVDALQRGGTEDEEERALTAVLLGTPGEALTELKNLIDAGDDHHDLMQVVRHDLDDAGLRKQLLAHFAAEATSTGEVKVLSDIDDTLYPNLKDERWPGKDLYPGVRAFYAALDHAVTSGAAPVDGGRSGDLAFITARPGDRAGIVEDLTHGTLRKAELDAVVLAGGFTSVVGNERIAARKYQNFVQYQELFPEYRFVWVGDSGQGDAIFGARLRRDHAAAVPAAFIHDVIGTAAAERERYRGQGVYFFDTYVGAATQAHALGLVTDQGLRSVVQAAERGFANVSFSDAAQRDARRAELDRDVATARGRLAR